MKSLEEEYKALQGDKAVEIQYFQSLDETVKGMRVLRIYVQFGFMQYETTFNMWLTKLILFLCAVGF